MPNQTCTNMLKVCALRAVRLDPDGTSATGADAMYVTTASILFGYTPAAPDRERFESINGCGDQCALYIGPPKAVDSVTMRVNLCQYDGELIELLAGGSVITDGTYGTIGYLAPTDATVNVDGVAIETWAMAWNGRQRAFRNGLPAWYRHLFPKTTWQVGEVVQENDIATIPLTGTGEVNSAWGTGLAGDDAFPTSVGQAAFGWFSDTAKPAGACGYQTLP
jgi:hypothetical protein